MLVHLPAGTTFGLFGGGTLTDVATDTAVGSCYVTTGTSVACTLYNSSYSTAPGDALSVTLTGVNNTTTAGPANVTVSTSSDTVPVAASVNYTPASRIVCAKVSGSATGTVLITKCTPASKPNKTASGSGSALVTGGGYAFTWSKSLGTSYVTSTVTSPGRGSCAKTSVEYDVTGDVYSGSSTYTQIGDLVTMRICAKTAGGAVSLVKGTTARL